MVVLGVLGLMMPWLLWRCPPPWLLGCVARLAVSCVGCGGVG